MYHMNGSSMVPSVIAPAPTVFAWHSHAPAKKPSCCFICNAVFLLIACVGVLAIAIYIATESKKKYHYAHLVCGFLSLLTSIIALYAGQDIDSRRGWVIAASTFGIVGLITNGIGVMIGVMALQNKEQDCMQPACKIKPTFEISLKNFDVGGVSCTISLCFDGYEAIWILLINVVNACIFFHMLLVFTVCCQCIINCCCPKEPNTVSSIAITQPTAFPNNPNIHNNTSIAITQPTALPVTTPNSPIYNDSSIATSRPTALPIDMPTKY